MVRIARLASAFIVALAPAQLLAQRLGQGQGADISWGRIAAALILCFAVAAAAVLWLKRRGGTDWTALIARAVPRSQAIHVVETRRIGQSGDVALIRSGGREYLILGHANGHRVLHARDVTDAPSSAAQ